MSDEENNYAWDDNLLIKAYDDSVKLAREDLARRIADSTNRRAEVNKELADTATGPTTPEVVEFKVGDFARATYTDGLDYEGTVISINAETASCVLRYVGYENEQEVPLAELLPSWGKKARREQVIYAKQEEAEKDEEEPQQQRAKAARKSGKGKPETDAFAAGRSAAALRMPPPPPLPPMFNPNNGMDGEAGQDLAAMLMSWYMSGYYTGLYQGKMQGNSKQKKCSKNN
ncbi:survival motor neuron protein [Scaptodrosophila lebanonensis]|uniref:Survival motor neuron protein n=1 Tax=Drosophila lebanonensis TaxID=7225 RepID=A0A6J2TVW0_DROLE|nr:survival motor neuron protein [Scaptodrosophila lebanonensis]